MSIRRLKFDPFEGGTSILFTYEQARPAHLGVLNAFFKALGYNVAVSRHHQGDGGQLYFHERDDLQNIQAAYVVDAGTFYQQTVEQRFRADELTFGEWVKEADERQDTFGTGRCYRDRY